MNNDIQIYQTQNWEIEVSVDIQAETIWLDSYQIAEIFWKDRSTIQRHIKNIYNSEELDRKTTCAKNAQVQIEWWFSKTREIEKYNLDMILSIWYRVNSKQATEFRKWATSVLKNYLLNGYVLNKKRLEEKWFAELEHTLRIFRKTLESPHLTSDEAFWLLDIITKYTNSWLLLQKYDENALTETGKTLELHYRLEAQEAYESLRELKKDLIIKGQATELFANPRENEVLEGIFGNVYQTFGGEELYATLEEKAANLLYFIVKNHPFSDGNKRSGAFLFIVFLAKNRILFDAAGERKINDRALVAITLLIAESDPKDKDIMVRLVMNLIV